MILERVEIVGFRGINRLSLMLEQNNVLIGENAWGKSSLLDALTLLLSPESELYHFERDDFWFPPGEYQRERTSSAYYFDLPRVAARPTSGSPLSAAGSVLDAMHRWLSPYFLSSGRGECGRRQRDDTAQFSR